MMAGFPLLQKTLTFFEINFLLHRGDAPRATLVHLLGMLKVCGLALFLCQVSSLAFAVARGRGPARGAVQESLQEAHTQRMQGCGHAARQDGLRAIGALVYSHLLHVKQIQDSPLFPFFAPSCCWLLYVI